MHHGIRLQKTYGGVVQDTYFSPTRVFTQELGQTYFVTIQMPKFIEFERWDVSECSRLFESKWLHLALSDCFRPIR